MRKEVKEEKKKDYKQIVGKLFFIFFICCVIGYVYEVMYSLINIGVLRNSGFLYGPYLPVYGTGALLIYLLLYRFKDKPVIVFLSSSILNGAVEYFTGFWMYAVYHKRWWNYAGFFLNINGYVCLASVLLFGVSSLLLVYVVIPLIDKLTKKLGSKRCFNLSIIIAAIMIIDLVLTILFRY